MGFILPQEIEQFVEEHTSPQGGLLSELDRETHLHFTLPQMISGTVQGKFLEMISGMLKPQRILEIGTFTGYSAICLAKGLQPGGKLITIDVNEELQETVQSFISRSGMADRIDFRLGNAMEIVPGLNETFDLVFIDADKENYAHYYDLAFPKVRLGGYILADNVLWGGKVVEARKDKDTQALVDYSAKVQNDSRVENVMVSVRDGIMIAKKIKN
jgi:predicted O-methyltransferase YrrM